MSEEMKQSFPNPTCPYCGMNMKSGDGSWWCTDKTCHEELYPYGIAQTSDWKEEPAAAAQSEASEYESASEWYVRMGFTAIAFGLDEAFILAERYAAERQRRG